MSRKINTARLEALGFDIILVPTTDTVKAWIFENYGIQIKANIFVLTPFEMWAFEFISHKQFGFYGASFPQFESEEAATIEAINVLINHYLQP